jgi:multicomponent Na+:H+ antiporter subunit G
MNGADLLIWFLLIVAIGFALLAFVGLLIFPDIRSRRFTASRAALISTSLVTGAVIVFGLYRYPDGGADYLALVVRTIILWLILALTSILVSRKILRQVSVAQACQTTIVQEPTGTEKN